MRSLIAAAIVVLFACAPARGGPNDDPPLGIIPTTMKLQTILQLHTQAVGTMALGQNATMETWQVTESGLSGTLVRYVSGDNYREDLTLGPLHSAQGRFRGVEWEQDEDGITVTTTGIHRRDSLDTVALEHASSANSGVSLVGLDRAENAYVVKVSPNGGRVEYLFFDKDTHLIVRTEKAIEDQRVVTTYDDFRTTNGRTIPWHT